VVDQPVEIIEKPVDLEHLSLSQRPSPISDDVIHLHLIVGCPGHE